MPAPGSVGKYNADTGAAISEQFLFGLNGPQGIAASGGFLYVGGLDWSQQQTHGRIGKFNAVTAPWSTPTSSASTRRQARWPSTATALRRRPGQRAQPPA
ncbi:MAG: hypothetical protein WDO13_04355 [Verrucomicrobiota bacterium]